MMKTPETTPETAFKSFLRRGPLVVIAPYTARPALDPAHCVIIEYTPNGPRRKAGAPIDHSGLLGDRAGCPNNTRL